MHTMYVIVPPYKKGRRLAGAPLLDALVLR